MDNIVEQFIKLVSKEIITIEIFKKKEKQIRAKELEEY